MTEKIFKWLATQSEKKPWAVIAFILIVTAFALWGATFVHQDYGFENMLPKDYESVQAIYTLQDDFGGVASESVLIEADDVLRGDVLRRVAGYQAYLEGFDGSEEGKALLWGNMITAVTTPLDKMVYLPADGSFDPAMPIPLMEVVDSLSDEELTAQVEANIVRNREQAEKMGMPGGYVDVIDPGGKALLIKVSLNDDLNTNDQIKLAEPFVNATNDYFQEPAGLSTYISGTATSNKDSNEMMMKDTMILFLLAFVFILVVLYITFRRFSDVLLTLMVLVFTIIWVVGLSGWLNFPFTYSSSAIMPLLLGIDIAYAIHFMSRYYEERRKGNDTHTSAVTSVVTVGVAVFLTAFTTAFGFASFGISNMPNIVQFGMLCVAGVLFSFLLAVTLLPAAIVLRDRHPEKQEKWEKKNRKRIDREGETRLDRSLAQVAVLSEHHRAVVMIITLIILITCVVLSFRLTTETDMSKMMPDNTPSAIADDEISYFFGGQFQAYTLIAAEDVLEPAVLASILEYEDLIAASGEKGSTGSVLIVREKAFSVADLIARANNGAVPATRQQVQAIFDQLAATGATQLVHQVEGEDRYDVTMLTVAVDMGNQDDMKRITEIMRDGAVVINGGNPDVTMQQTGLPALMTDLMSSLVPTQLKTSGLALLLCALLVMIIFKSVFFGLAATSVVFVSIAVEIGALVLLGWPLDFMTVMISSLVIGAGIDYGIHITHRFMEEWHSGGVEIDEAIRRTVGHVGKALIAAAVTTAGAFAIIGTSDMVFMQRFGLVTALSLTVACLCSLLMLPSILAWWALRVERKRKADGVSGEAVEKAGQETAQ